MVCFKQHLPDFIHFRYYSIKNITQVEKNRMMFFTSLIIIYFILILILFQNKNYLPPRSKFPLYSYYQNVLLI